MLVIAMNKKKWFILFTVICLGFLGIIGYIKWFVQPKLVFEFHQKLDRIFEKSWFNPEELKCYVDKPMEFYSAPEKIKKGVKFSFSGLEQKLRTRSYRKNFHLKAINKNRLKPGWFISLTEEDCRDSVLPENRLIHQDKCLIWKELGVQHIFHVGFSDHHISVLEKNRVNQDVISLSPFLFAQYEGEEPIRKHCTPFHKIPLYCALAVQAAEDHSFIVHKGISKKGILRAVWRNILSGRFSQGGSTITQQVVKNMFLTSKKSLRRKFKEQLLAQELEKEFSKEQILETYLNIVYMGQSGSFRVHGFGAASLFYIGKPVSDLNLSECAFLAGIIQSPGKYNPFISDHRDRILKRRNHILNVMYNLEEDENKKIITQKELQEAINQELPKQSIHRSVPSAYFTDTVYKRVMQLQIPTEEGVRIFTTLNPEIQNQASLTVPDGVKKLEEKPSVKSSGNSLLQVSLINVDIPSSSVQAVMGGRDFKISQFNRVLQSRRQIGSLMKPIAMLSALVEDPELHPLFTVVDKRFTHQYENQTWSPKNYKSRYKGEVSLYEVLKYSLNSAQADLSLQIGLQPLVQMVEKLGGPVVGKIHPSLILGAVELSSWEIAQIFLTIAKMGEFQKLHIVKEVQNWQGQRIYRYPTSVTKQVVDAKKVAVLIGMLKQVIHSGTARALKRFPIPLAGKTGTTNNEKDSWFVGFTPETLTLVWIGFDDNRTHHLTGSEGALPVWQMFMRKILNFLSVETFPWPEGVVFKEVSESADELNPEQTVQLVFEE